MPADSILDASFQDLSDALADFQSAQPQNAPEVLGRFVVAFDAEPLAGFLVAALPRVDFSAWLVSAESTRGGMAGSPRLDFPTERGERVAIQVALVRHLAGSDQRLLGFAHDFCNAFVNQISAHYARFAETVLAPMLRDLDRLAQTRSVPPVLFAAMGSLPPSGDSTLDGLLGDAIGKFKDSAPRARQDALEHLWDAWERLKSLEVEGNKTLSVRALLDRAGDRGPFRDALEAEARALTAIGNTFHIRHFETDRIAIQASAHADYLFHRLFALIHLLLFARSNVSDRWRLARRRRRNCWRNP